MAYFPPTGSVVAFQDDPTKLKTHSSVSGTVGASIIGRPPMAVTNTPSISGTVEIGNTVTINPTSVSGTVGASVIGTVPVVQSGTRITSISGIPQASVHGVVSASIGGTVSVLGTVPVTQSGAWSASMVGAPIFAEDAGHTTADKGIFVLGVRNDAVASFVSANLDYSAIATDSAGRPVTKPFAPEESRIEGYASLVSTSVTTLVAAAGTGLRNYITDFFIANTGATTTLITFKDGAGSILGYTIAPTAGGSNAPGIATPFRTGANASFDFQPTSASSILYVTVKGFKAP